MTALHARLEQHQTQKLSPRLQQAVRLLQLSSLEFMQQVHAMLDSNPFLETPDTEPARDETDADREPWHADARAPGASRVNTDGGDTSAMNLVAAMPSLTDHLHGQLNVLPLPLRDRVLAKAIVESLDDDGYLRTPLDELATLAELDPPASDEEMRIALCRVQSLEPSGVAARSVAECLLLQVPEFVPPDQRHLARRIVTGHLDALAASRDPGPLARRLGLPVDDVAPVCDQIRRFDPHPGWRYGQAQVQYITPDVIVKKVRGEWLASLNPAVFPKVRLNQLYADLYHHARDAHSGALATQLRDARWTVRNVQQRFSTILDVAQAIVRRQGAFFELGAMAMKPLALREIADEVGVHESTVSRVTNNKYMATRHGVYELKHFFSRAMKARSGAEFSGTAVRGLVAEMIEAESPQAPLSDAEIARILAQQGLAVARRTVTKYRQQLRVEPVERRRRSAA
ncbi:RNA polymerase factor sigma-54 [Rhizobacter sp. Root1221]|uniref:RNA polymerase factor sigma-54 n=1 Tax=Rhizobacter sp. Root1221 TaxID=1736433 RepID=UPI0007020271|nr:RNA polymerase factor sigma-54 [Rhizobacter sp. Root1221]KQV85560.1 RNA polymerase sigma-54 factor [Rhizobacter sp. Root1221]